MKAKTSYNKLPIARHQPITPELRAKIRRVHYKEGVNFGFVAERFSWIHPKIIGGILSQKPSPAENL
jgi:hypothetical protein